MDRESISQALGVVGAALPRLLLVEPADSTARRDWRGWQVRAYPAALASRHGWLRPVPVLELSGPGRACPSDAFLGDLILLAFALFHRSVERGPLLSAVTLARLVAERIEGRPAPGPAPGPAPAGGGFVRLRRKVLGELPLPDVLLAEMDRGRPFVLRAEPPLGSTLLKLAGPAGPGAGAARAGGPLSLDVLDVVRLRAPWYAGTVEAVFRRAAELGLRSGVQDADADRRFLDRLARGEIRGRGRHASYCVRRADTGAIAVAHRVPGPFLQEAEPGSYILWERPLEVAVWLDPDRGVQDGLSLVSDLAVVASEAPGWPGRDAVSALWAHAHVDSGSRRICMGSTYEACRRLGRCDLVHALLEAKLGGASRVLRYGWKRSNRQTPYHDYRWILAHCRETGERPPYVVLDRLQAEAFRRAHAAPVEIIHYDR